MCWLTWEIIMLLWNSDAVMDILWWVFCFPRFEKESIWLTPNLGFWFIFVTSLGTYCIYYTIGSDAVFCRSRYCFVQLYAIDTIQNNIWAVSAGTFSTGYAGIADDSIIQRMTFGEENNEISHHFLSVTKYSDMIHI